MAETNTDVEHIFLSSRPTLFGSVEEVVRKLDYPECRYGVNHVFVVFEFDAVAWYVLV